MDIKYKLFPYPVLWNKNDDYKTSTFDCDIQLQREMKKLSIFYILKVLQHHTD